MKLWQKILAAKQQAEAAYPIQSHERSWEERDMHIFAQMVKAAASGEDDPEEAQEAAPAAPAKLKE